VENDGKEWPKERSEQLALVKAEYFSEAKNITVAESKLLLLGLESASLKLRKYTDFLKILRRQYYTGKAGLTEKEMEGARQELLRLRQEFFAELSSAYKDGL
jgi:predicted choloylglycine hydrolase